MKYMEIPYVDKKVSRILYGTAAQPFTAGLEANELLNQVYQTGVTAFDTARNYGDAEKSLGIWLEECRMREKVVILSKGGHPDSRMRSRINEKEIREDLERSLECLRTDYIDIYLLHRDDPSVEAGRIVEIMNALHAEGKIGAFGGSNWTYQRIAQANDYAHRHGLIPFTVSSPNFGLAEQITDVWGGGCVTVSGPQNAEARKWYSENQIPVIAYSSLGRGLFSGKLKSSQADEAEKILDPFAVKGYICASNFERLRRCEILAQKKNCTVPQIALAWIFHQALQTCAVVSTAKVGRLQENVEALEIVLSEKEARYLDLEVDNFQS